MYVSLVNLEPLRTSNTDFASTNKKDLIDLVQIFENTLTTNSRLNHDENAHKTDSVGFKFQFQYE